MQNSKCSKCASGTEATVFPMMSGVIKDLHENENEYITQSL